MRGLVFDLEIDAGKQRDGAVELGRTQRVDPETLVHRGLQHVEQDIDLQAGFEDFIQDAVHVLERTHDVGEEQGERHHVA